MNIRYVILIILIIGIGLLMNFYCCSKQDSMKYTTLYKNTHSISDVQKLFDLTPEQIARKTDEYIAQMQKQLDEIVAIPAEKRTKENTLLAADSLFAKNDLAIFSNVVSFIEYLHPDEAMRTAAHDSQQKSQAFYIQAVSTNKELYKAFKEYAETTRDNLTSQERYFLTETLKEYELNGLNLPDEQLEKIRAIKKDLADLGLMFEKNIFTDNRTILATEQELAGVNEAIKAGLKKDDHGNYILGMDYPTVDSVLQQCTVEKTRERMFQAFSDRAYPANEEVLKAMIAKRDELAHALGFDSFAALNIANQMAKTPERAYAFLDSLLDRARAKEEQELNELLQDLPAGVTLTAQGKIKPWDLAYIRNEYKKKHFALDEQVISEYFPMEHTIAQLLDIYRQFLSVDFEQVPASGFWHEDVQLIKIYTKDRSQLLGYLLLDLFPRPNKFSHAAVGEILPAIAHAKTPAVAVMMANFPKASGDRPSLWKRKDVQTFFHEFGHALHDFLGRTELAACSGTRTKTDFVELPSQLLEEWLKESDMLRKVSKHYKTGEPLPDAMITEIIRLPQFDSGNFVKRQVFFSLISLDYFAQGAQKDPYALWTSLNRKLAPSQLMSDDSLHPYANFGHLGGYGAKYYGYMWSKVFALDIFETIKKHGLLDPVIGHKYVETVLSQGGSKDPNEMLVAFLGREPRSDAFFESLGL